MRIMSKIMKALNDEGSKYLEKISERHNDRHITQEFQLIGLEVADILRDRSHKALYIKLTKQFGKDKILSLAKTVSENKNVDNLGAYFMRALFQKRGNYNGR